MEVAQDNTVVENNETRVNNILLLVEDPIYKRRAIAGIAQHACADKNLFHIAFSSRAKKVNIINKPWTEITVEDYKKSVQKAPEVFANIQEDAQRAFGDKGFVVIVVSEPKTNFLQLVLGYPDRFPVAYHLDLDILFKVTSLHDALTLIKPDNERSFMEMKIRIEFCKYNHASPFSLGSEMWPYSLRVLFNILNMTKVKTITYSHLKELKERYDVRLDLSKAFAACCSKHNPKLNILQTSDKYHSDKTVYTVDYELLGKIIDTKNTPTSPFAPLIVKYPYLAYNSSIIFNPVVFGLFLNNEIEASELQTRNDEQTTEEVSDDEETEIDDTQDNVVAIIKERKLTNPHFFRLDKNFAPYLLTSENNPAIKTNIEKCIGEILIDGKVPPLHKMSEDIKSMSLGFTDTKITPLDSFIKFKDYYENIVKTLTGDKNNTNTTEHDFFRENKGYELHIYQNASQIFAN